MPIASSRQAEEYRNIKKVSNFILGEQPENFRVKYTKHIESAKQQILMAKNFSVYSQL
jgi:hypothetical protein